MSGHADGGIKKPRESLAQISDNDMLWAKDSGNGLVTEGLRLAQSDPPLKALKLAALAQWALPFSFTPSPSVLLEGSCSDDELKPRAVGPHPQGSLWLQDTAE